MSRLLLTTLCRESGLYDYFRENAPRDFCWRFGMPRRISFGLRFLRQKVPVVSILEYSSCSEYAAQSSRLGRRRILLLPRRNRRHASPANRLVARPRVQLRHLRKGLVQVRYRAARLEPPPLRSRRPRDSPRKFPILLRLPMGPPHREKVCCQALVRLCRRPHRTHRCPLGGPASLFPSTNRNKDTLQPFNLNVWKQRSSRGTRNRAEA